MVVVDFDVKKGRGWGGEIKRKCGVCWCVFQRLLSKREREKRERERVNGLAINYSNSPSSTLWYLNRDTPSNNKLSAVNHPYPHVYKSCSTLNSKHTYHDASQIQLMTNNKAIKERDLTQWVQCCPTKRFYYYHHSCSSTTAFCYSYQLSCLPTLHWFGQCAIVPVVMLVVWTSVVSDQIWTHCTLLLCTFFTKW